MENHKRNIEKLRRICDRKVTTGKVYWNAKDVVDYVDVDYGLYPAKMCSGPVGYFQKFAGSPML